MLTKELAAFLALGAASAAVAAAIVGPVLTHLKQAKDGTHPIITPFARIYAKGQELGEFDP